jgi:ethanolamine ammonia-lyase large subunit
MGVDVCYTNHTDVDGDDTDVLTLLLGAAGCSFVIAGPGLDDVMLHYQSLSFQDVLHGPAGARSCGRRRSSRPGSSAWTCSTTAGRVRELACRRSGGQGAAGGGA